MAVLGIEWHFILRLLKPQGSVVCDKSRCNVETGSLFLVAREEATAKPVPISLNTINVNLLYRVGRP